MSNLFVAHYDVDLFLNIMCLVDNSCCNHMTGLNELFSDLDETQKMIVSLSDNKKGNVDGNGTMAIKVVQVK